MKLTALLVIFFCAAVSNAADILNWNDLELGIKYHSKSAMHFENGASLSSDTPLVLTDVISGEISVIYFEFQNLTCTDFDLKADMILVNPEPEDTSDDKSVGVVLDSGCKVGIYVEPRHYYNKSLLY